MNHFKENTLALNFDFIEDVKDYTININGNLGDSKLYDDCKTTLTIQGSVKDSRLFAHSTSGNSTLKSFEPFLKPKKPIIVPCQQTFLHEGNLHDRIIIHSDMIYFKGINVCLNHLINLIIGALSNLKTIIC